MTIREFADELAALPFDCVVSRFDDIPKALRKDQLPASWFEMPSAVVDLTEPYATFALSGAGYSGLLFIAVAEKQEGFPAHQRDAVLTAAEEIEVWARTRHYRAEITTAATLSVANVEYRGVGARITAPAL